MADDAAEAYLKYLESRSQEYSQSEEEEASMEGYVDWVRDNAVDNSVDNTGDNGVDNAVDNGVDDDEEDIPVDWQEAAAELFPQYWAIISSNEEVLEVIKQAYDNDWEPGGIKFEQAIRATDWYQTTTQSAREWDLGSAQDPATYQTYVDNRASEIAAKALNFGVRLSSEQIADIATRSLRQGWNPQTIDNMIAKSAIKMTGSEATAGLVQGYYGDEMKKTVTKYGVNPSETTFNSWVQRISTGDESLDTFDSYLQDQAKTMYPALAGQFDAGRTFEDAVAGYRELASRTLEIDPYSIDFTQPEWAEAITFQPDPANGEQRMMNLQEWGNYLRNTESFGYEYTSQAKDTAYKTVETLANIFGKV